MHALLTTLAYSRGTDNRNFDLYANGNLVSKQVIIIIVFALTSPRDDFFRRIPRIPELILRLKLLAYPLKCLVYQNCPINWFQISPERASHTISHLKEKTERSYHWISHVTTPANRITTRESGNDPGYWRQYSVFYSVYHSAPERKDVFSWLLHHSTNSQQFL